MLTPTPMPSKLICISGRVHVQALSSHLPPTSIEFHPPSVPHFCSYPSDVHFVSLHLSFCLFNKNLIYQQSRRCRGLKVLVDLLDEDLDGTENQGELVRHALNDISSVFDLQSPTTKNGFCRMFIREGLLDPLSHALGTANGETKKKVIQIFLMFSQVSQSDIHVRNALGTRKVVRRKLVCTSC
jgi:hypothetical protein